MGWKQLIWGLDTRSKKCNQSYHEFKKSKLFLKKNKDTNGIISLMICILWCLRIVRMWRPKEIMMKNKMTYGIRGFHMDFFELEIILVWGLIQRYKLGLCLSYTCDLEFQVSRRAFAFYLSYGMSNHYNTALSKLPLS